MEVSTAENEASSSAVGKPDAIPTASGHGADVKAMSVHETEAGRSMRLGTVTSYEEFENDEELNEELNKETLHRPANKDDVLTHAIHVADDPSLPAVTFRSMFLGVCLSIFGGVLSGIYYFKPQTITLSPVFLAMISFLLGEAMSLGIPRKGRIGKFLNPHPFNIKEHLAITIMANSASISALGIEIITVERLWYGQRLNGAVAIFMLLSSQFLGYGIAGLMRRTFVYPKSMLWPSNIPINSMLETLHRRTPDNTMLIRVFLMFFGGIFLWEIFPQWICPILTGVSIFCLANQHSGLFTNIFGGASGNEGSGLFSLCFDWQYISGGTSPLYFPLESLISQGLGVCGCIILFASVYYGNVWDSLKYPFLGQVILSNSSTPGNFVQWNQTAAIGPDNRVIQSNVDKLGLPAFSGSNVLNLMLTNMSTAAAIVHMFLWFPREMMPAFSYLRYLDPRSWRNWRSLPSTLVRKFRRSNANTEPKEHYDPHYTLLLAYKSCPDWWFGIVLILSFVVGLVVIYEAKSTLPWWGFIVSVLLGYILTVVFSAMQGVTGVPFTGQSIVQMVGGYLQPGDPLANCFFALYGYNSLLQGKLLAQDLKLAQYGHLAPRTTFTVQMLGTVIGAVFNYIMANQIITNQAHILKSIEGTNIWSGQQAQQFNAQAVTFGGLPHQLFSLGGKYQWVTLATLPGFLAPVPLWLLHKKWPKVGFNNINTAVVIYYMVFLNVGINSSLMMFFAIGFFSQWWLRRRYPNVFVRYNYLVSAALDGGTAVIVFILSFAVQGAAGKAVNFPIYWGNNRNGNFDWCKYTNG